MSRILLNNTKLEKHNFIDLGSSVARREGSSPFFGTTKEDE